MSDVQATISIYVKNLALSCTYCNSTFAVQRSYLLEQRKESCLKSYSQDDVLYRRCKRLSAVMQFLALVLFSFKHLTASKRGRRAALHVNR
jgi:aerobic-type carbon monoxide dehydrogenase small subunit (CoxS/CutS family)